MDTSYFNHIERLAATVAEFFSASPGLAAWLQAIGSLIALITVSLVPWLKARARQRAFLLRGRILVQEADALLGEMNLFVSALGEVLGKRDEMIRIANEFRSFPVEELSGDVGMAFHKCRMAFLNLVKTIEDWHPYDGVLPPGARKTFLYWVLTFQNAFKETRGTFQLRKHYKRKLSKAEREIHAALDARKEEFEAEYNAYLERSQKVTEQPDAAPTSATGSDGSAPA